MNSSRVSDVVSVVSLESHLNLESHSWWFALVL